MYPLLAESLEMRGARFRNRIFSSGHQTLLAESGLVSDALIAYHQSRALGGIGLIVTEAIAVHESAYFNAFTPIAYSDRARPGFARLAASIHAAGAGLIGQLFHPGAEVASILDDGTRPVAWGPSSHQQERYLLTTRAMSIEMIEEVIESFGESAARLIESGLDGVEVLASHGYLPIQFCNPRTNVRDDEYGGSFENRMRFIERVHDTIRRHVGDEAVVGLRISADDRMFEGFSEQEVMEVLKALDDCDRFDYFNITLGSSATTEGAVHICAPMSFEPGYVNPYAERVKRSFNRTVLATGRYNHPQLAEDALRAGRADMIGMTRAHICDPQMSRKALENKTDSIRFCIACNQACIGHYALNAPISCIQHPESGRELKFGKLAKSETPNRVLVIGGGPAGLKAAAVAAAKGNEVLLVEKSARLGGQALLAQMLPERGEFGGIIENLEREARLAGAEIRLATEVTVEVIRTINPTHVLAATGAISYRPHIEVSGSADVVDAWQVIKGDVKCGARVVIADWRGDWIGIGIALKLVRGGHHVTIVTVANCAGINVQYYTRDPLIAELDRLGVCFRHNLRIFGVDENTAYFVHTNGGHPVELEGVDTLVVCYGHQSFNPFPERLQGWHGKIEYIGDALTPRTAEEAVYDALKTASKI